MDLDAIVSSTGIGKFFLHSCENDSDSAGFTRSEVIRFDKKFRAWQDKLGRDLKDIESSSYLTNNSRRNSGMVSKVLLMYLYQEERKNVNQMFDVPQNTIMGREFLNIYNNLLHSSCLRIKDDLQTIQHVAGHVDVELLLGGYLLGVPLIQDYIHTPSHLFDVFSKARGVTHMTKAGNMAIAMQAGIPTRCINPTFTLDVDEPFYSQNISGVISDRVSALLEGPVYVKPRIGSMGNCVISLTYDKESETLHLRSPHFHRSLMLYTDNGFHENLMNAPLSDGRVQVFSSILNDFISVDSFSLEQIQNENDYDADGFFSSDPLGLELTNRMDLKPLKYLHRFESLESEDSILFSVKKRDLPNFVKGLELLYYGMGINSNWDRAINCPKIGNMPFEIRVIWMNGTAMTKSLSSSYAKVSTNGFTNGISDGGVPMKTEDALGKSLAAYFPQDSAEDTKEKVLHFSKQIKDYFSRARMAMINHYVTGATKLSYPLVPKCDVVNVDFMIDADAMQAYAIDVNLLAGVEGFRKFRAEEFSKGIEPTYDRFIRAYGFLKEEVEDQVMSIAHDYLA